MARQIDAETLREWLDAHSRSRCWISQSAYY
jgi:hypothetical protein